MSGTHGMPWLEREDFGDVTVARLKTPSVLDDDTLRAVFAPIYTLVGAVGRTKLVLNLAAAGYLPSMGLGKLLILNRKSRRSAVGWPCASSPRPSRKCWKSPT